MINETLRTDLAIQVRENCPYEDLCSLQRVEVSHQVGGTIVDARFSYDVRCVEMDCDGDSIQRVAVMMMNACNRAAVAYGPFMHMELED
jgi:hypothetical protein